MKNNLFMDFSVDRENSIVNVKREFAAPISNVWAAWTEKDLLDQWWAPKPWKSRTKSMDFKVGGRRLYAMVGPEGEEHWALADFKAITPATNFKFFDAFCDPEGNINADFPRSDWSVDFTESNGTTIVTVAIKHEKLSDLEAIIEMGFKEGFTSALEGLDEIFSSQKF
ncbi:SRPBCC family protein [Pedobacter punctiformis]|uniref:SRPBCC domain-containing protein n=1 Tax=Pedobacter punctiformis TaxID=3004097 RepID=A0ABT4L839_9SPHI|nr:SRPBCC domain-containing protein [Pedobacter sp. HCMS5-2]MCZ4244096.1 SRPBCC domain-containing protein [Pedobacter sp. HCMS5-2]